ncbi:hypothetical protein RN001_008229 [Aquatica leii]|uniref:Uncharacterized protein n=1 Tax=Aquatica leii TaxID=1421715 RepID=A0AAN7QIW0_9COLE|nr:hypothetical protein RN001_008229 [Aquatica leii]
MLKVLTLTALLSVAVATPGSLRSASVPITEGVYPAQIPIYTSVPLVAAPVAITKQAIPIGEPQDVTYTRTDIISRKVTSSAPHPHVSALVQHTPHTIKNTYYTEENIVRGQPAPIYDNGPEVEANYRKFEIKVPEAPQTPIDREQPRPLHMQQEEIPAPVLSPYPQPSIPKPNMAQKNSFPKNFEPLPQPLVPIIPEPRQPVNPIPKNFDPNVMHLQKLTQPQPNQITSNMASIVPFLSMYAYQTPLTPTETGFSVGYPISGAKLTDIRKTYFTPLAPIVKSSVIKSQPQITNEVYNQPLVAQSEPCDEPSAVEQNRLALNARIRSQINHGNGAVSTIYY